MQTERSEDLRVVELLAHTGSWPAYIVGRLIGGYGNNPANESGAAKFFQASLHLGAIIWVTLLLVLIVFVYEH